MPTVKTPIELACEHENVGSQSALAAFLKIRPPTVNQWIKGGRPIPVRFCVPIEQITFGAVKRWDLRPKDWFTYWPELIGTEGAPQVPQLPAESAQPAMNSVAEGA
ncbi:YdaS family helix-turn-helix protein [uncultured Rhodoferax sp.]|uniref:transcriptional regulator n=1 Tax=uncultured Rhodoferax sp. TaxID=223188 RepID=UPI0025EECAB0|nr:YdaS family helix-turn-helix protein [uncultured Rhodoferax sp.]